MGSQALGKELMDSYGFDSKAVSVSAAVQRRAKILPAAIQDLFHKCNDVFPRPAFFMAMDFTLLTVLIFIFQRFLMIMAHITVPIIIQKVII